LAPTELRGLEGKSMNGPGIDKVVVVVDLSRYSDICRELEQQLDVTAVAAVNKQVKDLIGLTLAAAGVPADRPPYKGTGDGAIIALDTADEASRFAEHLHRQAESHNRGKDVPLAQRHFRVGIWLGKILLQPQMHGKGQPTTFEFAGTAIANAVRLEGACKTGEVLIGSEAWANLEADVRSLYGHDEVVKGKRNEEFHAHRRKVVDPAPWDAASASAGGADKPSKPARPSGGALAIHRRRLEILEQQAAMFGPLTPPYITMDIEETKRVISDLES
jgi:class 3 adenylate cyclase